MRLANGTLHVTLTTPGTSPDAYTGTRFDQAGIVRDLRFADHRFFGPWFTATRPDVHDFIDNGHDIIAGPASAATGPAEEFEGPDGALGFNEAPPGGTFVKVGVGILRRPDDRPYTKFRPYVVVDPGTRTTTASDVAATFTHALEDAASGCAYVYEKTCRLDGATLAIAHRLDNHGRRTIDGTVYNHNFLVVDDLPTGPDLAIDAVFPWQVQGDVDPSLARIEGRRLCFLKTLTGTERISTRLGGFGETAADYDFRITHAAAGVGVRLTADRPLARLALWSIRSVMALEPFIALDIPPGGSFTWTNAYEFFTHD